jgi:hypothetical protein
MKAPPKKDPEKFNTLNHSVALTTSEITHLRRERKATIKFLKSMRTSKK